MGQLKKQRRRGGGSDGGGKDGKPPPLNAPFLEAKKALQELVKPAPPPPPRAKVPAKPVVKSPYLSTEEGPPPESDADLFAREMTGVRRMGQVSGNGPRASGRERPIEQERAILIRQSEDAESYAQLSDLVEGIGPFDISDTDEYIEGIGPGLDRRLLQRLRRGDYAVQSHIDLHGLKRDEARIRVEQFLHEARLHSHRCVLIIHGRGLNSKDQIPVLKESVRIWLTRGRISRSVLCFATARPTDGGAGAVYVLLRR
jgi:DNA-nicking Smr family endonuclease